MTGRAEYRNHGHYAVEGWSATPKRTFTALAAHLEARLTSDAGTVLDVGCATGELIDHLARRMPDYRFAGVDVTEPLLDIARERLPHAHFETASALALPTAMTERFDVVCALGCMSIFDETAIGAFWDNLVRVTKPGGLIVVLAPLNEHGADVMIRHRKRARGAAGSLGPPGPWETGWNVFSTETVAELVAARGLDCEILPFRIDIDLPPREDPVRTWTVPMRGKQRQLVNGLKLMIDHYFVIARRRGAAGNAAT